MLTIQRPVYDGSNDVQTVSASRRRLLGVLRSAQEKTERVPNVPLYYDLSSLSKTLHSTTISLPNMQSALLNAGYIVGASHCAPNVVKTDAPPVVIRNRHSLVTAAIPQRILLDSGTHSGFIQSTAVPLNSNKSVETRMTFFFKFQKFLD